MPLRYSTRTVIISSTPSALTIREECDDGGIFIFYSNGTYKSTMVDFQADPASEWKFEDGELFYRHLYGTPTDWCHWSNQYSELKTKDIVMNWMIESAIFFD